MSFVLRRLLASIPVIIGVTIIAFLLIHLVPGDPAQTMLFGSNASPEQIDQLRDQLGLNQSLWHQYFTFAGDLLHGDLGTSYVAHTSVAYEFVSRTPSTLALTGTAILVAVVIGVPLGL